jgi:hypothetical protein
MYPPLELGGLTSSRQKSVWFLLCELPLQGAACKFLLGAAP